MVNARIRTMNAKTLHLLAGGLVWLVGSYGVVAHAAVLPEDRTDVLYHGYDGGGLQVQGPSVIVRKGIKDKVSVWANYYVDLISSASIDVITTASPYEEERQEKSVGIDYLYGKTSMGLMYLNSEESDYSANAARLAISQDFFGDLTTIGIAYGYGWDEVRRNGDADFGDEANRQSFRLDFAQVATKSMTLSANYEFVTDEGFLNNPYRTVRYLDPSSSLGYSYEQEIYPRTRSSSAVSLRAMYYMPYRAALKVEGRYYTDSWGIDAYNGEISYVHPFGDHWTFEGKYRFYSQTAADFYSDLYERQTAQNFLARDKELATFTTNTVGVGASYEFPMEFGFFKKAEVNTSLDYILFNYDDFRDVSVTGLTPGDEPLYDFDSFVLRVFFAVWY